MTQIASLLIMATIFTLMVYNVYIYSQMVGAYTRDKTIYAGTSGGRGVIAGFYSTCMANTLII